MFIECSTAYCMPERLVKWPSDYLAEQGEIPNGILHEKLIHVMGNIWPKPSADEVGDIIQSLCSQKSM